MKRQMSCAMILLVSALRGESTLQIAPDPGNEVHLYVEKTGAMSGKKHDFVFTDYSMYRHGFRMGERSAPRPEIDSE